MKGAYQNGLNLEKTARGGRSSGPMTPSSTPDATNSERPQLSPGLRRVQRVVDAVYQRLVGAITSVATTEPLVALTFDDGPDPTSTPEVLRLLAQYDARATFFMVGAAARRYPALVRQVAAAGHTIANHSWNHESFTVIDGRQRRRQLRACQRAIAPYGRRLFRPPYGRQNVAARWDARLLHFQVVAWSLQVEDWRDADADRMAARLVDGVHPGSIVLLHDAIFRIEPDQAIQYERGPLLQALELFLAEGHAAHRFVTVPELLARGRPVVREWYADEWSWGDGPVSC
jgi:peptidoglycan/xylan/chitin deacetylase (PgdA/CDA1 family)